MAAPLRYWDACTFLGWLNEEVDKIDECRAVINMAKANETRIVTSSITLAEVVKLKGHAAITKDKEETIRAFFMHEWIVVEELDRFTAEYARQLVWAHGLDPKDCIHVATAVGARVPLLETFDAELLKRSGQIGDPPLLISRPELPPQGALDVGDA